MTEHGFIQIIKVVFGPQTDSSKNKFDSSTIGENVSNSQTISKQPDQSKESQEIAKKIETNPGKIGEELSEKMMKLRNIEVGFVSSEDSQKSAEKENLAITSKEDANNLKTNNNDFLQGAKRVLHEVLKLLEEKEKEIKRSKDYLDPILTKDPPSNNLTTLVTPGQNPYLPTPEEQETIDGTKRQEAEEAEKRQRNEESRRQEAKRQEQLEESKRQEAKEKERATKK